MDSFYRDDFKWLVDFPSVGAQMLKFLDRQAFGKTALIVFFEKKFSNAIYVFIFKTQSL